MDFSSYKNHNHMFLTRQWLSLRQNAQLVVVVVVGASQNDMRGRPCLRIACLVPLAVYSETIGCSLSDRHWIKVSWSIKQSVFIVKCDRMCSIGLERQREGHWYYRHKAGAWGRLDWYRRSRHHAGIGCGVCPVRGRPQGVWILSCRHVLLCSNSEDITLTFIYYLETNSNFWV